MKRFWPILFVVLACWPVQLQAGYCYTTPSYSGYSGYSYTYPYYSAPYYYPKYVAAPVASYVAIPIPIFGSVYVGQNGTTNITTTATRTTTATSTQAAATVATTGAGGAATTTTSDSAEILSTLKTLTGLVGQVAQKQEVQARKQEEHSQALFALRRDHAELRQRFLAVEAKVNGTPVPNPAPVPPPIPIPPPKKVGEEEPKKEDVKGEVALPAFYANKCFACHQDGSAELVKAKVTKQPIILFTKAGKRSPLRQDPEAGIDQAQSLLTHITNNSMPPPVKIKGPDGKPTDKRRFPELTPDEQTQGVLDVGNFPRRKS